MRFLQIYYPQSRSHDPHKYNFCVGKVTEGLRSINTRWIYSKPGTSVFNNFYLEFII